LVTNTIEKKSFGAHARDFRREAVIHLVLELVGKIVAWFLRTVVRLVVNGL
jgi:hypothetical protein